MLFRKSLVGVFLPTLFFGSLLLAHSQELPHKQTTRATIERALPFIEKQGVNWMKDKKCVTCHHSTFMVWSLNTAAERGFTINTEALTTWNAWARDFRNIQGVDNKDFKDEPAHKAFQRSPDVVSQLLLGRPEPLKPISDTEKQWALTMRSHLLEGQQADGSWKAGGQLPGQKRSLRETDEATTMWTLLTLNAAQTQDDAVVRAADKKGADWLKETTVGESTEWWAVKMMWARGRGQEKVASTCREKLFQSQHKEGGWGWLLTDESDALGTGIVLYALLREGVSRDHESIQRAVYFLQKTQREEGSWPVKGTKKVRREFIEATATYWGTCWATLGLLESLPPRIPK
ncbi:hypothetical protein [Armatimonas sp.]|uniref:hypothetical protein n=1 Tax=Armatimonas sp. TaxID=1872638 RepID=UPI00286CD204|nr:hypothetical protein [Armatimonas sp.]